MTRVAFGILCAMLLAGAAAAEESGFSFDPASVRFAYADGYWDQDHHWHPWPSARESREFHQRFQDRVYGYRHTRYPNEGWHDDTAPREGAKAGQTRAGEPRS